MAGLPPAKQGTVSLRYRSVAQTTFIGDDTDLVRRIVAACVEEELLELLPESTDRRFVVRLTHWAEWEPRDTNGSQRQHRYAERQREEEDPLRGW